jgi:hypothetical protein
MILVPVAENDKNAENQPQISSMNGIVIQKYINKGEK